MHGIGVAASRRAILLGEVLRDRANAPIIEYSTRVEGGIFCAQLRGGAKRCTITAALGSIAGYALPMLGACGVGPLARGLATRVTLVRIGICQQSVSSVSSLSFCCSSSLCLDPPNAHMPKLTSKLGQARV